MAKILRTEQLSVDGDNIRLTATEGNLIINSVLGDDLTQITSTVKIGQDISSLSVRDTGFDEDVSSLAANTESVESMLSNTSNYSIYSLETSNLTTGAESNEQTIVLADRVFVGKPTVTATLSGGDNDPIIAVMISDVSETSTTGVYQVTFQFSDELPSLGDTNESTSYKLNILASVHDSGAVYTTSSESPSESYGLSQSYANTDVDSHLNITAASDNQILSWNGSDYQWITSSGGSGGSSATSPGIFVTNITCGDNADFNNGITNLTKDTSQTEVDDALPVSSALIDTPTARIYIQWEAGSSNWTGTPYINGSPISSSTITSIGGGYVRRFEGYADVDLTDDRGETVTVTYSYGGLSKDVDIEVAGLGPSATAVEVTSSHPHGQDHYKDGDDITLDITFDSSDVDKISFEGGNDFATGTISDSTNFSMDGNTATITVQARTTLTTETAAQFKITAKNELGTEGETFTSTNTTVDVLSGPVILSASVGTYPTTDGVQQSELKNGDSVPVTLTFDTNNVNTVVFSGDSNNASGSQTVSSVSVSSKSATVNMSISGTNVSNNAGGQDLPFKAAAKHSTTNAQNGPVFSSGDTKVKVNNQTPTIATASITYPDGQQALKDSEQATVNMTVTNQGSNNPEYTYSDPLGSELTITQASSYQANKSVSRQGGGYNVSNANFKLLVKRRENGSQSSKTAIVNIANTAPSLSITSNSGTRMRSGGNDVTSQQNYNIVISTGGQRLLQAPTLGAPHGTLGAFNHSETATTFTASMGVHDSDSKGDHNYSSINAVNLAGKTVTSISSGDQYTFGGFVSRTIDLSAQTNEVSINVLHVDYSKVTMSWSGNSSVTSRQAIDTTTQTTNSWCLASTNSAPVTVRILDFSKTSASSVDTTITIQETA
jgi:hypothetical protein